MRTCVDVSVSGDWQAKRIFSKRLNCRCTYSGNYSTKKERNLRPRGNRLVEGKEGFWERGTYVYRGKWYRQTKGNETMAREGKEEAAQGGAVSGRGRQCYGRGSGE